MRIRVATAIVAMLVIRPGVAWAPPRPAPKLVQGAQVVFEFSSKAANGAWVVLPKGKVVMGLVPVTHSAPLAPGDTMLCTMLTEEMGLLLHDGKVITGFTEIAFRCGETLFVFQNLDVHGGEK